MKVFWLKSWLVLAPFLHPSSYSHRYHLLIFHLWFSENNNVIFDTSGQLVELYNFFSWFSDKHILNNLWLPCLLGICSTYKVAANLSINCLRLSFVVSFIKLPTQKCKLLIAFFGAFTRFFANQVARILIESLAVRCLVNFYRPSFWLLLQKYLYTCNLEIHLVSPRSFGSLSLSFFKYQILA